MNGIERVKSQVDPQEVVSVQWAQHRPQFSSIAMVFNEETTKEKLDWMMH